MGSVRPSPANTSFSSTLKLPPSRVSALVFFSHKPHKGRPEPAVPPHSETLSASSSVCTMGTSADWFFLSVTRSLSLYSKRSPNPWPFAAASLIVRAESRLLSDVAPLPTPPPLPHHSAHRTTSWRGPPRTALSVPAPPFRK